MRYFGAVSHGNASVIWRAPLGRRAAGHRKPQQLPTFVAENKKCEELLKRNRRNHEQINRRNPLHMIAQEGLPSLQWPIPPRGKLMDINAFIATMPGRGLPGWLGYVAAPGEV